jgi:hypothetical protein
MALSLFRSVLTGAVLFTAGAVASAQESPAARPEISSLRLTLDDGRSYSLSAEELTESKGGAIFWGDWAVTSLLAPYYAFGRSGATSTAGILKLWFAPGPSGELPAFLLQTSAGPVYPLERDSKRGGGPASGFRGRARVIEILVGYTDGRQFPLSDLTLKDRRSGVMLWNDFAVTNLLRPFYVTAKGLPTRADDVDRIWNQPQPAPFMASLASTFERPGFLVKPACIPAYPGPE